MGARNQLNLRFLGPPDVRAGSERLTFPTRKALALLVYLVVEGGVHARDQLAALFWPESDASRARATLRNCLHQLRSTLPEDDFLHVERDALAFNFDARYRLDLDDVAAAFEALREGPPLDDLQEVLDVARGEFLEGFSLGDAVAFDDWASLQRERWHQRVDQIFDALSRRQFEQGHIAPALETTRRWLAHHKLSETAYRRLMRLYAAAGKRAAALQAYEACRETLGTELDIEPAAETRALAARIEKGEGFGKDVGERTPAAAKDAPSFSQGPLVGREEEFRMMAAAHHRAAQGAPQVMILVGEAGMGKTRLAREFLAWSTAQGGDVLRGRSFESGQQLPYQPLIDALRPRVEAINAPEDYLSDIWLAEMSRLLPELRDRYPDLAPSSSGEEAARTRLFEAVARLTLSLAQRVGEGAPLVLFVDDVHWADDASLDVLQYLCRRWAEHRAPIMLLSTARSEALHPLSVAHTPQLAETLQGLERQLQATTLQLDTLTIADTKQFMTAFGADETDELVHWLFRETNGHPFFLVEMLEDLRQRGHLQIGEGDRLHALIPQAEREASMAAPSVPQKVRQVIAARLARLSPPAFDMLVAGAVLGQDFTFEWLCDVSHTDEGPALRAMDELLHNQLLREFEDHDTEPSSAGASYVFAHDKIRDVVYTEAGEARRRVFHRRALETLADRGAHAAQLARHARAAGDRQAAFQYSLRAGDESLVLFAARNAIAHYEHARALMPDVKASAELLRRLHVRLGRAYELVGDYQAALDVYGSLQVLARERNDEPLELAALMARTTVYAAPTEHYDPAHVDVLTEQALPLARALEDHAAEAKIQWNLMLLKLFTGDIGDAVAAGEASLTIACAHGLREREAFALHDLTRAYLFSGQPQEGLAAAERTQALWRELDNKAMLVDNLVTSASARFFWQGAQEELVPRLREALALSTEIDNLWNQSYANHVLGSVYPDLGYFSQAVDACKQSIELGQKSGFMVPLFVNGSILGWLYGLMGHPQRGYPWVERGLQAETGMRDQQAGSLATLAYLNMCEGKLDEADGNIRQSYEQLELHALSAAAFFTFPMDGRIRLARQEYDQALAVSNRFMDYLTKTGLKPFRADALLIKGRALLALGRKDEALEALAAARQEAEVRNTRRILWEILALQATMAEDNGDRGAAQTLRRQAREIVDFIAAHIDDEVLRAGFLEKTALD